MKHPLSHWYLGALAAMVAGIFLLWSAGRAIGQPGPLSPGASLNSQITYQGQLTENGLPVDGTRNMIFRFYTDGICTSQAGADILQNNVPLSGGLFTVLLDVDQALFNGQALWLQVEVEGTPLGCQPLTPAPYALGLRPGVLMEDSTSSSGFGTAILNIDDAGTGRAVQVRSLQGTAFYAASQQGGAIFAESFASESGSPASAVYGYATGGYGVRGVTNSTGSAMAGVVGESSGRGEGGRFTSQAGSGVTGETVSVSATPVPGLSNTYVAGVRGLGRSSGLVYGVYGDSQAGANGAGVYATNTGSGQFAPDLILGARNAGSGTGYENGVLSSDPLYSNSRLFLRSNDDISLQFDADFSFDSSQLDVLDRAGNAVFTVADNGDVTGLGIATGTNGLRTGNASGDGLFIQQAGTTSGSGTSAAANGVEIRAAANDGLMVGWGGGDGVDVWNVNGHGIFIRNAASNGLQVAAVGDYGLNVLDGRNHLAGDTGVGTNNPLTRLHVQDSLNAAASRGNHVALIENTSTGTSPDVLAIQIGETKNDTGSNIDGSNNFISFLDGGNSSLGAIQGNGSGGVALVGPGNDYAEYLPRLNPAEEIAPGAVVGIFDGQVSQTTDGASLVLVASTGAIVAGNDPGEAARAAYTLVAFLGQAQVQVRGPVAAGDFLVPSGLNDGTAVAVTPAALQLAQLPTVLGQAWESSQDAGVKPVRSLIGLVQPAAMTAALQGVDARLAAIEAALNLSAADE